MGYLLSVASLSLGSFIYDGILAGAVAFFTKRSFISSLFYGIVGAVFGPVIPGSILVGRYI